MWVEQTLAGDFGRSVFGHLDLGAEGVGGNKIVKGQPLCKKGIFKSSMMPSSGLIHNVALAT